MIVKISKSELETLIYSQKFALHWGPELMLELMQSELSAANVYQALCPEGQFFRNAMRVQFIAGAVLTNTL